MADADKSAQPKFTALYWLGFFLMVFGATLAANFVAHQIRESDQGHTYYEFMGGGGVAALAGVAVMVLARRRARALNADPGTAPDRGRT